MGPIFSFASAHNVNELHAHSMRLQQMLLAQSQTITWSRWQYTLIENFEDPAEGTPSVSRSSFVSHAGSWLRLIAPVLEVGLWSQKIQPSFSSSPPISSCKTYRTVVGVSDSLLSDPIIELRCFLLSIRKSTTSGSARPTDSPSNRLIHKTWIWFWGDT